MSQTNPPKKVLFVCTGNTCRSPMAEIIFKAMAKKENIHTLFKAGSAGLYAQKEPMSENSKQALKQLGYTSPKSRLSRQLTKETLNNADIVFTMTDRQKAQIKPYFNNVYSMSEILGYEIDDPYGGSYEQYLKCAINLEKGVKEILNTITK